MSTTYYVNSTTGNDSTGDGSQLNPWLTYTHAVSGSVANDIILGQGTFNAEPSYPISLTSYRTLSSYGTGATIAAGASRQAVLATNCGMTVQDLTLTSNVVTTYTTEVAVVECVITDGAVHSDGFIVKRCIVTGGSAGIECHVTTNTAGAMNNITIGGAPGDGNIVSGCIRSCIRMANASITVTTSFSNVLVSYNTASGCLGCNSAFVTGSGITIFCVNNLVGPVIIEYNTVFGNGNNCATATGGPAGIFWGYAIGLVAQHNVVHDQSSGTVINDGDGMGFDVNCSNCTMQYNVIYNTTGPGIYYFSSLGTGGNVVRWNIVSNVGTFASHPTNGGLQINGPDGCDFYNNTIISNSISPGIIIPTASGNSANKRILNNIVVSPPGVPAVSIVNTIALPFTIDYNSYQSGPGFLNFKLNGVTKTTLATWQSATSQDANSVGPTFSQFLAPTPIPAMTATTFQTLAKCFSPLTGSVMANSGANLSSLFSIAMGSKDVLNVTIPSPYTGSLGAISTPASPTPYQSAVLTDGPIIWTKLNDPTSSPLTDAALSFGNGSYTATTLNQPNLVPGDTNATSAIFNGTTSFGLITPSSIKVGYTQSTMTVEAWVNFPSFPGAIGVYAASYYSTGSFSNIVIGYSNTNAPQVQFIDQSTGNRVVGNATSFIFATNTLYHVVWVWGGSNSLTLYINGIAKAVTLTTQTTPLSIQILNWNVGSRTNGTTGFIAGNVQEIAVYPTVLSSGKVFAHYNAGITSPFTPPSSSGISFIDIIFIPNPIKNGQLLGDSICLSPKAASNQYQFLRTDHQMIGDSGSYDCSIYQNRFPLIKQWIRGIKQ